MSKKEKSRTNKEQSLFTKETMGVVFVLFSALCLVLLITGDAVFGKLGTVIDAFLFGAFGKFAYAVTLFGVIFGLILITGKKIKLPLKTKFFGTLAFAFAAAFFHVLTTGVAADLRSYADASYQMGANGFASASAGGYCTALYAYVFSKLTVAGGSVVLALLTLICAYFAISEAVRFKKQNAPKEERFKGVFVESGKGAQGEADGVSADNSQTSSVAGFNGGQAINGTGNAGNGAAYAGAHAGVVSSLSTLNAHGSAIGGANTEQPKGCGLFINNASDFAFKTKRENKQKTPPVIKIEEAENGLTVGNVGASYTDARVGDLQQKLEYIKMPAKINIESDGGYVRTVKGSADGVRGDTNVSDYISPEKRGSRFGGSVKNIPMYEHDGNKTIGSENGFKNATIDDATARSAEFDRKYGAYNDGIVPNVPVDSVKPAEAVKPEATKRETVTPEEIKPAERADFIKTNGNADFAKPVTADNSTPLREGGSLGESRITRDRNISNILFGDNKDEAKTAARSTDTGYESRVEKDGNRARTVFGGDGAASASDNRRATNADGIGTRNSLNNPSNVLAREGLNRSLNGNESHSANGAENVAARNVALQETSAEPQREKKVMPLNVEYHRPPFDLLETYNQTVDASEENHEEKLEIIRTTLEQFHINVEPHGYVQGPSITRYELNMPAGISVKNILKFDDDLRMRLASRNGVRIEAPIPGKNLVGVEVANKHRITVGLKEVLEGSAGRKTKKSELIFALGKDIVGNAIVDNLAKGPHFLVAGATGSGKSVCLNVMIVSMLMRYSPQDLRLILVDPKRVGFRPYEHLPHLLIDEIITEPQRCIAVLTWAYNEMERRYTLFETCDEVVSDIDAYNAYVERNAKNTTPRLPRIVIIFDEVADFMETCKKDMESRIRALAQKARAAGVHLVLATQRPSVDIITGTIKANLPSRIALKVMNFNDSQTILSEAGAEKLLGNGDMLYKNNAMPECERYQGAWISDREINNVVSYIIENNEAYFDDELSAFLDKETKSKQDEVSVADDDDNGNEFDDLFLKALALAINSGTASISQFQRRFQIGYARAGGIVDKMERCGFISGNEGSKARKVLITREEYESRFGQMPDTF